MALNAARSLPLHCLSGFLLVVVSSLFSEVLWLCSCCELCMLFLISHSGQQTHKACHHQHSRMHEDVVLSTSGSVRVRVVQRPFPGLTAWVLTSVLGTCCSRIVDWPRDISRANSHCAAHTHNSPDICTHHPSSEHRFSCCPPQYSRPSSHILLGKVIRIELLGPWRHTQRRTQTPNPATMASLRSAALVAAVLLAAQASALACPDVVQVEGGWKRAVAHSSTAPKTCPPGVQASVDGGSASFLTAARSIAEVSSTVQLCTHLSPGVLVYVTSIHVCVRKWQLTCRSFGPPLRSTMAITMLLGIFKGLWPDPAPASQVREV